MPNPIEPAEAQTNIAKFNKSAIVPAVAPRIDSYRSMESLFCPLLQAGSSKLPLLPRRGHLCDCRRELPALTRAAVDQENTPGGLILVRVVLQAAQVVEGGQGFVGHVPLAEDLVDHAG